MTARDTSSPGFVITVIAANPELRIDGKTDPTTVGKILENMDDVNKRILSFTYEDDEKAHDVLKLKVDNQDMYFMEHPAWIKGNLVRFFFGYPGRIFGPKYVVIDSVQGFLELDITCVEDAALANISYVRKFENFSIEDVIRRLIVDRSFGPNITAYSIPKDDARLQEKKTFSQSRQSDWQFLQRLAEPLGYEVYIEHEILFFKPRDFSARPDRSYEYWYGIGDLLSFDIKEWRAADRPAETVVVGRNPIERKTISATGSNTKTTRDTLGNQNSVSIRADRAGALQRRPAGKTVHTTPAKTQGEAKTEADSRYRKQEQKEVEASARIIGDPELRAKSIIKIVGISRQLSGLYYVKKHVHTIDRSNGYTGDLSLLRNAVTAIPTTTPPTTDPTKATENKKDPAKTKELVIRAIKSGKIVQQRQ